LKDYHQNYEGEYRVDLKTGAVVRLFAYEGDPRG